MRKFFLLKEVLNQSPVSNPDSKVPLILLFINILGVIREDVSLA